MSKQQQKKLQRFNDRHEIDSAESSLNRARAITVGTCFGGTTEITMRANNGSVLWSPLQPVEVIELIHQLAANVGCHIHLQPRNDFASWRKWKVEPHMNAGPVFPPFVNDMAPHQNMGQQLPAPDQQPGLQSSLLTKDEQNETMATKKPQNRRSAKRTSAVA